MTISRHLGTVAHGDKTLQNTSQNPKHVQESKTRTKNQKHIEEAKILPRIQNMFGFWEVFLNSRKYFGFWEVFLDSEKCFWILGSVFESLGSVFESLGRILFPTSHRTTLRMWISRLEKEGRFLTEHRLPGSLN